MAVPFDPTNPRHLSPEQRLDELASVFATGVRRALALRPNLTAANSEQIPLDVPAESRLHVPVQLTQAESTKGVEA